MATDSKCWHCGAALTPATNGENAPPTLNTAVPPETLSLPDVRTVLVYAGLTAVSLLLLIFTTRAIGQAPLLLFGGGNAPLSDWQPVTDSQLQFTLNLPETWQSIELSSLPEADNVKNSPPVQLLGASFDTLVVDSDLLWLAATETAVFHSDTSAFVLVARSERLQLLSADQFLLYAQEQFPERITIAETEIVSSEWGLPKGNLIFDMQQTENQWRCQEQFVPTAEEAYLITACSSPAQFSDFAADFDIILRSFQPLDS